jgi:hypothetical protein
MDNKIKHLEMIQSIINRMSNNSFLLKGWMIAIISALFVYANVSCKLSWFFIEFLPVFSFWVLDGYYLRQEKLFRALYDKVRVKDEKQIDYSMDTNPIEDDVDSWVVTLFSPTLWMFYIPVIVIAIILLTIK